MKTSFNYFKSHKLRLLITFGVILVVFSQSCTNNKTLEDNRLLLEKFTAAFNDRTPEILEELTLPKFKYHQSSSTEIQEVSILTFYQ